MSDQFTVLIRVRYAECDAQQVVFNARYAEYVDVAMTEFYRHLFGGYQILFQRGLDNQIVRMLMEWKSSARFDDVLALQIGLADSGTTSFTLKVEMKEKRSGRLVALCEAVYVMVTTQSYQKTPIPEDIREKLQKGLPGLCVDMSG